LEKKRKWLAAILRFDPAHCAGGGNSNGADARGRSRQPGGPDPWSGARGDLNHATLTVRQTKEVLDSLTDLNHDFFGRVRLYQKGRSFVLRQIKVGAYEHFRVALDFRIYDQFVNPTSGEAFSDYFFAFSVRASFSK
jgi:hypothetical protein